MSQSLSKLYVHIIFHVKDSSSVIRESDMKDICAYIGSIIKSRESFPIIVNGTNNHIHILCVMSKNIALAKLVEDIKRHSSRWIKQYDGYYGNFAWQGGYAAFSVSQSVFEKTKYYIENQYIHHKKITFSEELILFLKEYDVEYNEDYL